MFVSNDLLYKHIKEYLKWGTFPTTMNTIKKCQFKQRGIKYTILGDVVYRRVFDGVLIQYLEWIDQQITMHTCHDDACGCHFNGFDIAKRLIRMGYYQPMMKRHYHDYIKKFVKYQQHANLMCMPSQALQPIQAM